MDSDSAEMLKEVKDKVILHWNCRGLTEFPEIIRHYGSHIQEIYLKWNKLNTLPPWIIELFNVTNLYIYGNLIKDLPPEIGNMPQLTVLDLSANKLKEIPSCIGSLFNLKTLLLNDNFIQKLPFEMSKLHKLETLSICGNQFIALPEWLGSLDKLKELDADNNYIKELPNRLTLAHQMSMISVCSNRLRYLPLNGFLSSPNIRFNANEYLNYLSYPLLYQLISQLQTSVGLDSRSTLAHGCFKANSGNTVLSTSIKLNIKSNNTNDKNADIIIELPRQLLKVHNINENEVVSLWELALRTVYKGRYKHTLNICISPINIKVHRESIFTPYPFESTPFINCAAYNLLMNGPTTICVNSYCQQPIFTEAWVIAGNVQYLYSVTTIALCCSKRCACNFIMDTNIIVNLQWNFINT